LKGTPSWDGNEVASVEGELKVDLGSRFKPGEMMLVTHKPANARENMPRNVSVNSGSMRFAQNISVGSHALEADEPSENGGSDVGPNPHELLLAALGACASITVQMYAGRKQWPVEAVHVRLSYVKGPAEDQPDAKTGKVDGIEMEISCSGDLSQEQQRRLLEIAERCPVHRMLTSQMQIQTHLLGTSSPSL
jgi:uncharacterized OsmC-like protein